MNPTSSHRDRPRGPKPAAKQPRLSTDLGRFEPQSPTARRQVDDLIARGAQILEVTASHVLLLRDGHRARIDALGRVEWLIQSPAERRAAATAPGRRAPRKT